MKRRDAVTIIVCPSVRGKLHPITAFVAGEVHVEGYGQTCLAAIEDLFTCATATKACRELERLIAAAERGTARSVR